MTRTALQDDVVQLQRRADDLTRSVLALEARAVGIEGFTAAAPYGGDRRIAECAGVGAGSAVARVRSAGKADLAVSLRGLAAAVGAEDNVSALLDVAGAAIAWAAVLSIAEGESAAFNPMPTGSRAGAPAAAGTKGGRPRTPAGLESLRTGVLALEQVLNNAVPAGVRRTLAGVRVHRVLAAAGVDCDPSRDPVLRLRLGELEPHERQYVVQIAERHRQMVAA